MMIRIAAGLASTVAIGLLAYQNVPIKGTSSCGVMACVESLELPRVTDGLDETWLGSGTDAAVTMVFDISPVGRAINITVRSPTVQLGNLSSRWLAESRFRNDCAGRKLWITFQYHVVRRPVSLDLPAFSIKRNNTIDMTFPVRSPSPPLRLEEPK